MVSEADLMRVASELQVTVGRLVRRIRSESSFPTSQAIVLGRLERDGPSTTSALAVAEFVRPQSMAQTIAELEANGLVERRPDPDDRRQTLIEVTGGGREILAGNRLRSQSWLAQAITGSLEPNEQELLVHAISLLGRVAEF